MVHENKEGCCCGGLCCCSAGKAVIGVIGLIVALVFAFWLVKFVIGVTVGIITSSFLILPLVGGVIGFIIALCIIIWVIRLPFRLIYGFGRRDIRILRRRYAG